MQGHSNATAQIQSERFLSALIGKPIMVFTLAENRGGFTGHGIGQAGELFGRLESNYPDALVLEIVEHGQPTGSRLLVYKRAIVAIEARGTTTP